MKKQNIIICVLLIIIVVGGILFFVNMKNKAKDKPNTTEYSYIVETSLVLDTENKETKKIQTQYLLDDKNVCISKTRNTIYSDEEEYKNEKLNYDDTKIYDTKSNSADEEKTTTQYMFDDNNFIITEIIKFRYNEVNTKDDIINVIKSKMDSNNEYLVTNYLVY